MKEKVSYFKKELFFPELSRLKGNVLEVGFGDGENFQYYSPTCQVFALDKTGKKILNRHSDVDQKKIWNYYTIGKSENMPYKRGFFDSVVASFVLCSVNSVHRTVIEIKRVLKPNGKLFLLEHIKSDIGIVGKLQDFFATPYSLIFNNCHPNRNPVQILLSHNFDIYENIQVRLYISHLLYIAAQKRG